MTDSGFKLNMAVPNGIILGIIGALVLITPLAAEGMERHQVVLDLIAGGILLVGGVGSLVYGLRTSRGMALKSVNNDRQDAESQITS